MRSSLPFPKTSLAERLRRVQDRVWGLDFDDDPPPKDQAHAILTKAALLVSTLEVIDERDLDLDQLSLLVADMILRLARFGGGLDVHPLELAAHRLDMHEPGAHL
jgi:hypothetical protein